MGDDAMEGGADDSSSSSSESLIKSCESCFVKIKAACP